MKAVLMSIQPKWCALIRKFLGWDNRRPLYKKRLELRKSKPKIDVPFKVYIYETKTPLRWNKAHNNIIGGEGGYVIGEFVCDYILGGCEMRNADIAEEMSCVSREDILKYSNGKEVFGWHISNLKIYDKPKELSEFKTFCKSYFDGDKCDDCKFFIKDDSYEYDESDCSCNGLKPIERPPQSWCYVEGKAVCKHCLK